MKLRVLGRYLESTRGLEEDDLTNIIKLEASRGTLGGSGAREAVSDSLAESDGGN